MYMDKLNGIQVAEKLRNMNYKGKLYFLPQRQNMRLKVMTLRRVAIWLSRTI